MASIFNALHVGYSGLKTSQIAIDTTGHNIANAENPAYTRQRAVIAPNTPLNTTPGDIGLGAKISEIVRIHDEFVFKRLKNSSGDNEYAQLKKDALDELSSYFPEIDKNGIYNGMQEYFNAWNDLAKNSDDSSLKINLAQATRNFTATIRQTRSQVESLRKSMDERIETAVDEINRLGRQIADINVRIGIDEAGGNHANDLRDQRDKLELALSKLVDISVSKGDLRADMTVDRNLVESGNAYHLNIGGASFVDGPTFHPITFEREKGEKLGKLYYVRQDYEKFDLTGFIRGGQIGAMLSLRDGDLGSVLDDLDTFVSSMAMYTNDLYAAHATNRMESDRNVKPDEYIANSDLPISNGNFYVKVYDIDGNEVVKREVSITDTTKFSDIVDRVNADIDDNQDNLTGNDVDDFLQASIGSGGKFVISLKSGKEEEGYTFALEEADPENPTLFAGALGLARFFEGYDAKSIDLDKKLSQNPTSIGGNAAPVPGDNSVANAMVELQYQKVDFYRPANTRKEFSSDTLAGFFRMTTTSVADKTAAAHSAADTSEALLNTVVNEFDSISKVDIDEELTNLMKYQTGYSASAKVITTIDQMIETLLGIKQ